VADHSQPNATRMPMGLLQALLASVGASEEGPHEVVFRDHHSNDFAEIRLRTGRALIIKRARFDWAEPRFRTSRIASGIIRRSTHVAVPAPLTIPEGLDERAVEVYWRIDQPTLLEVWPSLDSGGREAALQSWGSLLGRLHGIRLEGAGPLSDEETPHRRLGSFLSGELRDRLLPAVTAEWPGALGVVERLILEAPEVERRVGDRTSLVHNDMHMGNVLCRVEGGMVSCVGLLDLETAVVGPPEADVAGVEVHHGALFAQPIEGGWQRHVRSGYGRELDEWVVNFYRAFHLLNMGFYSAMIGHHWHAERVGEAAVRELEVLGTTPALALIA